MNSIEVTTKAQLKKAKEEGFEEIIIVGALACNVRKAKKVTKLGAVSLGIVTAAITAAVATAPLTGGLSFVAAAPIAAVTGVQVPVIIALSICGVGLIIALFKDYEEIEFGEGPTKLKLKKKSR